MTAPKSMFTPAGPPEGFAPPGMPPTPADVVGTPRQAQRAAPQPLPGRPAPGGRIQVVEHAIGPAAVAMQGSPFAQARAAAQGEGQPARRTVTLDPSAWAARYKHREHEAVEVGLCTVSMDDRVKADAAAMQKAFQMHPQPEALDDRIKVYNETFMALIVARGTCLPGCDTDPYFAPRGADGQPIRGPADDVVPMALTHEGIGYLFDAIDAFWIEESPTSPMATDADLAWLAEALRIGAVWNTMTANDARATRRLLGVVVEQMRGESDA